MTMNGQHAECVAVTAKPVPCFLGNFDFSFTPRTITDDAYYKKTMFIRTCVCAKLSQSM